MEAPDVTGSSLTLGTAGSRRTVYLIDELQKLPDGSSASPGQQQTQQSQPQSCSTPTPNNNNNSNANSETQTPQKNDSPATFLMYNRINTTIGGTSTTSEQSPLLQASGSGGGSVAGAGTGTNQDDKAVRKRNEDKSNSIWYEYGCV